MLEITDQTFASEVTDAGGLVLVDFWAPWCGPCRMLSPLLDELAPKYENKIKFGKLNVEENPHTPAQFGVLGIPNVIVFKDGQLLKSIVGLQPLSVFTETLDAISK